jgi:hypothetical protein
MVSIAATKIRAVLIRFFQAKGNADAVEQR